MTALARAHPSYEDLVERIAWLEDQLGVELKAERLARIQRLGLRAAEAKLLLLLHSRRGRVVTSVFADEYLAGHSGADHASPKIIDVWLSRIRKRLGFDAISTSWGNGHSLPPATVARLDALFEDLA